ncbi:MAG TPA: hypothetical protein VFR86_02220, partial [Burkholderiaceae bacterium]|nr:hypothetical protein [Burkholderiaceae bacterium]
PLGGPLLQSALQIAENTEGPLSFFGRTAAFFAAFCALRRHGGGAFRVARRQRQQEDGLVLHEGQQVELPAADKGLDFIHRDRQLFQFRRDHEAVLGAVGQRKRVRAAAVVTHEANRPAHDQFSRGPFPTILKPAEDKFERSGIIEQRFAQTLGMAQFQAPVDARAIACQAENIDCMQITRLSHDRLAQHRGEGVEVKARCCSLHWRPDSSFTCPFTRATHRTRLDLALSP